MEASLFDPSTLKPETNEDEKDVEFSIKQLKNSLKLSLKQSGVLDTVKAQIRSEFIKGISLKTGKKSDLVNFDVRDRVTFSIIYFFLKQRKYLNSVSVFLAETGINPTSMLINESELIHMVKFHDIQRVFKFLKNNQEDGENELEKSNLKRNQVLKEELLEKGRSSLLDLIIQYGLLINDNNLNEISTQTEITGPGIVEYLECQLLKIRGNYQQNKESAEAKPTKTIEEKMILYQKNCEERLKQDLKLQIQNFKENELIKIRIEEASKYRELLNSQRKELEQDYKNRLQNFLNYEQEINKKMEKKEENLQKQLYESRQVLKSEIDQLRKREEFLIRKMELENNGVKILELRLNESENILKSREREINDREKKMEEKNKNYLDIAKKEAQLLVQNDLDFLSREKSSLLIEKKRFDEEKMAQNSLIEAAKLSRQQLKDSLDQLIWKEEEISSLVRNHERVNLQRKNEENQINEMLKQVDPILTTISRPEQIIRLIQQNADLEVRLAAYKDSKILEDQLIQKKMEIEKLENDYRHMKANLRSDFDKMSQKLGQTERSLSFEKSRNIANELKIRELENLLKDKSNTVETLQKQFNQPQNNFIREKQKYFENSEYEKPRKRDLSSLESRITEDVYSRIRREEIDKQWTLDLSHPVIPTQSQVHQLPYFNPYQHQQGYVPVGVHYQNPQFQNSAIPISTHQQQITPQFQNSAIPISTQQQQITPQFQNSAIPISIPQQQSATQSQNSAILNSFQSQSQTQNNAITTTTDEKNLNQFQNSAIPANNQPQSHSKPSQHEEKYNKTPVKQIEKEKSPLKMMQNPPINHRYDSKTPSDTESKSSTWEAQTSSSEKEKENKSDSSVVSEEMKFGILRTPGYMRDSGENLNPALVLSTEAKEFLSVKKEENTQNLNFTEKNELSPEKDFNELKEKENSKIEDDENNKVMEEMKKQQEQERELKEKERTLENEKIRLIEEQKQKQNQEKEREIAAQQEKDRELERQRVLLENEKIEQEQRENELKRKQDEFEAENKRKIQEAEAENQRKIQEAETEKRKQEAEAENQKRAEIEAEKEKQLQEEKEAEAQKQADAKAIAEARAKVLARRRGKQVSEVSASMPVFKPSEVSGDGMGEKAGKGGKEDSVMKSIVSASLPSSLHSLGAKENAKKKKNFLFDTDSSDEAQNFEVDQESDDTQSERSW